MKSKYRQLQKGRTKLLAAALLATPLLSVTAGAQTIQPNTNASTSTSQTIDNISVFTLQLLGTSNPVDITQNSGTTLTIANDGLIVNGGFNTSISGGNILAGGGELDVTTGSGTLFLNSALTGPTTALVLDGSGVLQLGSTDSTNNNFAGGIYLNGATLQISSDLNLGANSGNSNSLYFQGGSLQVINNDITLGASRTLYFNGGSGGGTINIQPGHTFTVAATNQIQGSDPLTIGGGGRMLITASNTYNGPVTVNGSVLELRDPGALGAATGSKSSIKLNTGAQLNLRQDAFTSTFGHDITVGGNSTIDVNQLASGTSGTIELGALNIGSSTLTVQGANRTLQFDGTTTISGNAEIANSVGVTLAGQITGNGSLTKSGSGVLVLGGFSPNTYANTTTVVSGTLELAKASGTNAIPGDLVMLGGTVQLQTPGQIANSSNVSITGGTLDVNSQSQIVSTLDNNGGTVQTGAGTLQVTAPSGGGAFHPADSSGYTTLLQSGTTLVNAGGQFDNYALAISGGNNIVQAGGVASVGAGGLIFTGANSAALTIQAAPSSNPQQLAPGKLLLGGDVVYSGTAGTAYLGVVGGLIDMGGGTRSFTVNDGSGSVDMQISATLTNGTLRKSGSGWIQLTNANSYAGGTILAGGTLEIDDPGSLGSGAVTFAGGTLALRGGAAGTPLANALSAAPANSISLDIGTSGICQVPSATIGSAFNIAGGGTATLLVSGSTNLQADATLNNAAGLTFSGAISGVGSLTKTLSGTLTFGGGSSNTYIGNTTVDGGTLVLAKSAGVAVPSDLYINGPATVQLNASQQIASSATIHFNSVPGIATLNLNGQSQSVAALADTSGGSITLGGGTLTVGGTNSTFGFGGAISGAGSLVKSGGGTATFTGANNFTGGASVLGGTLTFANAAPGQSQGTLSGGNWSVADNSTLNFNAGAITTNHASILLSGPNSSFPQINGLVTNGGTFGIADGRSFTAAGSFSNSGTLNVGSGRAATFNAPASVQQMSGSTLTGGSWNLLDNGILVMPNGTTINSLSASASVTIGGVNTSFPAIASLSQNAGQFAVRNGGGFTTAGNLVNTGTVSVGAGGSMKVSGNLTGAGGVSVGGTSSSPGSLTVNSFNQPSIAINAFGILAVAHNASPVVNSTDSLTIATGGKLDLANSTLMVHYAPGSDPLPTIISYLLSGYDNGKWDGSGIVSSTAAANALQNTTIGYVDSADGLVPGIPANTIELKYTPYGDTGLTGSVAFVDFMRMTQSFTRSSGVTWDKGDFNYDGSVNFADFALLKPNYGSTLGSTVEPAISAVPEPGALALGFAGFWLMLGRRRQHRRSIESSFQ